MRDFVILFVPILYPFWVMFWEIFTLIFRSIWCLFVSYFLPIFSSIFLHSKTHQIRSKRIEKTRARFMPLLSLLISIFVPEQVFISDTVSLFGKFAFAFDRNALSIKPIKPFAFGSIAYRTIGNTVDIIRFSLSLRHIPHFFNQCLNG